MYTYVTKKIFKRGVVSAETLVIFHKLLGYYLSMCDGNWILLRLHTSGVIGLTQKQPPECSVKKGVLTNFAKFTENTCARDFSNKVAHLWLVFFCEFYRYSKNASGLLLLLTSKFSWLGKCVMFCSFSVHSFLFCSPILPSF